MIGSCVKSKASNGFRFVSAEEEIRTPTPVKALPPQSSASTSFATSAIWLANVNVCIENRTMKARIAGKNIQHEILTRQD